MHGKYFVPNNSICTRHNYRCQNYLHQCKSDVISYVLLSLGAKQQNCSLFFFSSILIVLYLYLKFHKLTFMFQYTYTVNAVFGMLIQSVLYKCAIL